MSQMRIEAAAVGVCTLFAAHSAWADPCKAIPDKGPAPAFLAPGSRFAGQVVYVGDGDSLCVAVGPNRGADWVEVRLADFYAPEISEPAGPAAKAALERIAAGRRAECIADQQSWDRIVARCTVGGRTIGDLMRAAGVQEGGRAR